MFLPKLCYLTNYGFLFLLIGSSLCLFLAIEATKHDYGFFADDQPIKEKIKRDFFVDEIPSKDLLEAEHGRQFFASTTRLRLRTAKRQFSCTKRALMMYKLIVNSLHYKILDLSNDSRSSLTLKLYLSRNDIENLTRHLEELQSIIDYPSTLTSSSSDSMKSDEQNDEPNELIEFCRNLNNIERNIEELIDKVYTENDYGNGGGSNGKFQTITNLFKSNLWRSLPDNSRLMVMLFVTIQLIIFYVQRYYIRKIRTLVLATILNMVIFVSLFQHYQNMKVKFVSEQTKVEYNRQRYCNSWIGWVFSKDSYDCSEMTQSEPIFNPTALELMIQYLLTIWLNATQLVINNLNQLLEQLFDIDRYSITSYFIIKPILFVLVLYLVYCSFGFVTILHSIGIVSNLISSDDNTGGQPIADSNEAISNSNNSAITTTNGTNGTQPNSVMNIKNFTVNYFGTKPNSNDFCTNPSQLYEPDDEYLSAIEDFDD